MLVVNPFYRVAKAPIFEDASNFNFGDPPQRAKLTPLMGSIGAAGAVERDAPAFVAWLDSQRQVDRTRKIGTQGYCMGGPLVMRTAAAVPNRIGAGGSFHGGGLVTANPDSPHLLAPKIKAHMYFGVAANDDAQQPDAKTKLKEAFEAVEGACRDRGLLAIAARLVHPGHAEAGEWSADLQQGRRGSGLGKAAGLVQSRTCVINVIATRHKHTTRQLPQHLRVLRVFVACRRMPDGRRADRATEPTRNR